MTPDLKRVGSAVLARLPECARWLVHDTPFELTFSVASKGFVRVEEIGGAAEDDWQDLLIFGDYDWNDTGGEAGLLCLHESDGSVCGFNPDRLDEPVFVYNCSMERFIDTFLLLDPHLRSGAALPEGIAEAARIVDPDVYDASEWRLLIDFINGPGDE